MTTKACPKGCGPMTLETALKPITFRKIELTVSVDQYICGQCGLTASDLASTGKVQQQIAERYRQRTGLLPGKKFGGKHRWDK